MVEGYAVRAPMLFMAAVGLYGCGHGDALATAAPDRFVTRGAHGRVANRAGQAPNATRVLALTVADRSGDLRVVRVINVDRAALGDRGTWNGQGRVTYHWSVLASSLSILDSGDISVRCWAEIPPRAGEAAINQHAADCVFEVLVPFPSRAASVVVWSAQNPARAVTWKPP